MKNTKNLQPIIRSENRRKIVQVDGLSRRQGVSIEAKAVIKKQNRNSQSFFIVPHRHAGQTAIIGRLAFVKSFYSEKKVPVLAAVLALIIAFGGGVWATLSAGRSIAYDQGQVLGASTDQPSQQNQQPSPTGPLVTGDQLQSQAGASVSNNVLFNTPIEYLQNYFATINQPDIINQRKIQLAKFLSDMHSPLADSAEMIAQQSHWQLILAIAFAESSLGKNCTDFNCSNIGIKPGNPIWHKYTSYNDWVVDFNRLLDKKYNDWTLQQMCGVYVKPCNPNWLLATQQILDALNAQGIN